jgi:hypothetical protein
MKAKRRLTYSIALYIAAAFTPVPIGLGAVRPDWD